MSMVNMKQDDSAVCEPCPPEAYPYGLRICLNDDACEKLGILGPIKAGTKLSVRAITTVVRCSEEIDLAPDAEDKATGEKSDIYLDLQITDMEIAAPNSLYPNSMMKD